MMKQKWPPGTNSARSHGPLRKRVTEKRLVSQDELVLVDW